MSDTSKRDKYRLPIEILVDFAGSPQKGQSMFCNNLSVAGIFIETQTPEPVGSNLTVTFTLPNQTQTFTLEGVTRWIREQPVPGGNPGMGIQFLTLSPEQKIILQDAIEQLSTLVES